MTQFLLAFCFLISVTVFAQQPPNAPANPSNPAADTDIPKGTIAPPTTKQLKSVKKPKKTEALTPTTTPTTTPSH